MRYSSTSRPLPFTPLQASAKTCSGNVHRAHSATSHSRLLKHSATRLQASHSKRLSKWKDVLSRGDIESMASLQKTALFRPFSYPWRGFYGSNEAGPGEPGWHAGVTCDGARCLEAFGATSTFPFSIESTPRCKAQVNKASILVQLEKSLRM